jgi:hypothetical protein
MLNLHDDPEIDESEVEFANWIYASVQPVCLSRVVSPQMIPTDIANPPEFTAVWPPVKRQARTNSRRTLTAIFAAAAATIGIVAFVVQPKSASPIAPLYATPPLPTGPAMYLPQDLPQKMSVRSMTRPDAYPDGPGYYFGKMRAGRIEEFTHFFFAPNMTLANFAPQQVNRFVSNGNEVFEVPHPVGSTIILTTLGACGPLHIFSSGISAMQLAERSTLMKCENGQPVPTGQLGFTLLYVKREPTKEILKHYAALLVDGQFGSVTVNVRRVPADPPELKSLMETLAPGPVAAVQTVDVLGENSPVLLTQTFSSQGPATGWEGFSVMVSPKSDPTALITIDGTNEADVIAVAKSMKPVDEMTWVGAWKKWPTEAS